MALKPLSHYLCAHTFIKLYTTMKYKKTAFVIVSKGSAFGSKIIFFKKCPNSRSSGSTQHLTLKRCSAGRRPVRPQRGRSEVTLRRIPRRSVWRRAFSFQSSPLWAPKGANLYTTATFTSPHIRSRFPFFFKKSHSQENHLKKLHLSVSKSHS